jgi:hypothetical protein
VKQNESSLYLPYFGTFSILLLLSLGWHYHYDIYRTIADFSFDDSRLFDFYNNLIEFVSALSYFIGIGFGIKSALYFQEHHENPSQRPDLFRPVMYSLIAAGFLSLPSFLNSTDPVYCGPADSGVSLNQFQNQSL